MTKPNTPAMKITCSKKIANEKTAKARVYFFFTGCSTAPVDGTSVLDAMMNRRLQPMREYRKLLPEVVNQFPELASASFKWSQYAGCSCPCSPGFVSDSYTGSSYYIDVVPA